MKTQMFRFFDESPYGLHPVYWLHGGEISRAVNAAYGGEGWRLMGANGRVDEGGLSPAVTSSAELWEKFNLAWSEACDSLAKKAKARGDLIYMDIEHLPTRWDGKEDWRFVVSMAQAFKRLCPGLKLTCYFAFVADFVNNDWLIKYDAGKTSAEYNERVAQTRAQRRPLFELLDFVDISAYLLGAACFRRDIDCIKAHRRVVKRFYPHTEIIYSAWGRYHDNWNKTPEEYTIAPERLLEYARLLTRNGDKVILFSEFAPRDDYFVEQLKARSE